MKVLHSLIAALFSILAVAAQLPEDEQVFREQAGVEDYRNVSYQDSTGAFIDFQKFRAGISGGKAMQVMKNPDASTAVFSLTDAPVKVVPDKLTVKRGDKLPEASLRALDGRAIGLRARAGRPLLMNFFFAACAPCISEIPALNEFAKQRPGIDVVGVTFDDPNTARKFIAKHAFQWPVVAESEAFIKALGLKSYPTFLYLDKDGKLLGTAEGAEIGGAELTVAELDAWLAKLTPKK